MQFFGSFFDFSLFPALCGRFGAVFRFSFNPFSPLLFRGLGRGENNPKNNPKPKRKKAKKSPKKPPPKKL